jgi:hypothetical protein
MEIKFLLFLVFYISNLFEVLSKEEPEKKTKYSEILNKEFVNNIIKKR